MYNDLSRFLLSIDAYDVSTNHLFYMVAELINLVLKKYSYFLSFILYGYVILINLVKRKKKHSYFH